MTAIIGICGFADSGKGTVADYLVLKHGAKKISFADKLKDVVATMFGVPRNLLEGDTTESRLFREQPIASFWQDELRRDAPDWIKALDHRDMTWRWVLQFIGTEVMRESLHPNIWIILTKAAILRQMGSYPAIILPDTRFANEAAMIRDIGGTILTVVRTSTYQDRILRLNTLHQSETGWLDIEPDHVLKNDSTLEDLYETIDRSIGAPKV